MEDLRLLRIEDKVDVVNNRLGAIDSTLLAQHESLKEHIRRTELLEDQIAPLQTHMNELKGVIKFLKLLVVVIPLLEVIHQFLK